MYNQDTLLCGILSPLKQGQLYIILVGTFQGSRLEEAKLCRLAVGSTEKDIYLHSGVFKISESSWQQSNLTSHNWQVKQNPVVWLHRT